MSEEEGSCSSCHGVLSWYLIVSFLSHDDDYDYDGGCEQSILTTKSFIAYFIHSFKAYLWRVLCPILGSWLHFSFTTFSICSVILFMISSVKLLIFPFCSDDDGVVW